MPPLPPAPLKGVPKVTAAPQPLAVAAALATAPAHPPAQIVPPLVMPPLPAIPPRNPWMTVRNPSAQMVQDQYVDRRLEELEAERKAGRKDALKVLETLLLQNPKYLKFKKIPSKELMRVYTAIERNLRTADLTINFQVSSWFGTENPYNTYAQMYQRAVVDGQMMVQANEVNPDAKMRVQVDNQVTFPSQWQGVQSPAGRGLSPGRQGVDRIMNQMDTGQAMPKPMAGPNPDLAYMAANKHFNPNAKQIFLGLNYGRRPHGSTTTYGNSYFVLKNGLKARCLYYPGDTFLQQGQSGHAGSLQVAYDNLGAILGRDSASISGSFRLHLSRQILESCLEGKILRDSASMNDVLEAHYFGELRFSEHVDYMVISPQGIYKGAWPGIVDNARKFAEKQGIKIYQTN